MKFFKKYVLLGVVFVTGACVLVIEIVAMRVLSPYYGNTIFSVSSVITVILAALSIGYYIGGRLADRFPTPKLFYGIILGSGLCVLAVELLALTLLPFLGYRLSLVSGPLVSAMILFFLPGLLLGMLSPFAVKLQQILMPEEGIGTMAGKIFFWSTCGSIAGSLGAGFFLIPRFGVNEIFLSVGSLLLGIGVVGMIASRVKKESVLVSVVLSAVLFGTLFSTLRTVGGNVLYEHDGLYEKIVVFDGTYKERPARFLKQDWNNSSAIFLDSKELAYEYSKYYALYKVFSPDLKEALVIGAGAYSIPKVLLQELPDVRVDVVDIEPVLLDVGKQFFFVPDDPRLTHYVEDGRRFLHDAKKQYDFIFSDVYLASIPAHFTTKEFFEVARKALKTEGVFIANMMGDLSYEKQSFVFSEMKTLQSVFSNSYFFAVQSPHVEELQNLIFVGHKSDKRIDLVEIARNYSGDQFMQELPKKIIDVGKFDLSPYPMLTDNFSPVEYLTAQDWLRRLAEGR